MEHEDKISDVEHLMDDIIQKHPHSQEIVNAFRPVILERCRLAETIKIKNTDSLKIDRKKLRKGVPVIRQATLFHQDDPWEEIAVSLIPALKRGFPALYNDLEKMEAVIKNGNMRPYDYFESYPDNGENIVNGWVLKFNIGAPSITLLLKSTARIILEKRSQFIRLEANDWDKGYCPVCGAFPSIAIIKEKIAERWLHCSQCGYEFKFSRVICPYCEHRAEREMPFFFVDDREKECAFACDECKRYLITLTRVTDLLIRDLDVSAIGLTYLDIIMQGKGFLPMADCEWNVF